MLSFAAPVTQRDGAEVIIDNPADFPEPSVLSSGRIREIQEPVIQATIIAPDEYTGAIMQLCSDHRGSQQSFAYTSETSSSLQRVTLVYQLPLASVVSTFHSQLKSITSGYASFDYEDAGWQPADMVRMNILINSSPVDALVTVVHRSEVQKEARTWTSRLKAVIPRQQYEVIIQATVGAKVISRDRCVFQCLIGGHSVYGSIDWRLSART